MIYDATGKPLRRGIGYTAGLVPAPSGASAPKDAIAAKIVPRPVLRRRVREGMPRMEEKSR